MEKGEKLTAQARSKTVRMALGAGLTSVFVLVAAVVGPVNARTPDPYLKGVERYGLYCPPALEPASPVDPQAVCVAVQQVLQDEYGVDVSVGSDGIGDSDRLVLVINTHHQDDLWDFSYRTLSTKGGPISVLTTTLFRSGHINPRLRDMSPIVLFGEPRDLDYHTIGRALVGRLVGGLGFDVKSK